MTSNPRHSVKWFAYQRYVTSEQSHHQTESCSVPNVRLVWRFISFFVLLCAFSMIRHLQLGKIIHKLVHQFPKLELTAHVQPITRQTLKFDLILAPDFVYDIDVHGPAESFWVFVEDVDGEKLLHYELFNLRGRFAQEEATVSFTVSLTEPFPPQYFVRVVSDRWLHASSLLPVSFRHLILPEKYPPHTELLDLQPIPVTALADKDFQSLYDFKVFNPIQTQTFGVVYESDDSCFIGAPPGSDKLVCAELAMLRLFKQNPDATVVYVDPVQQVCRQRFSRWSGSFADKLGKHVVELTGETAADLRLLSTCVAADCWWVGGFVGLCHSLDQDCMCGFTTWMRSAV